MARVIAALVLGERPVVDHRAHEVGQVGDVAHGQAPRPRPRTGRASSPTPTSRRTHGRRRSTSGPGTRRRRGSARCGARRGRRSGGRRRSPCRRSRRRCAGRSGTSRCSRRPSATGAGRSPVEPVKWMPARSGWASATSETSRPSPGSMLMTPGGSPASSSSSMVRLAASCWVTARLPDDGVAHQRRRGRQVAGDRGEVERRDRVDEALERAVVGAVPDAGAVGDRLLGEDLPGEVDVEPPEVDQLAGRVDLGLERGLRLAEHGRGVEALAPGTGQQVGGLEDDRGPVVERHRPPAGSGVRRRP